MPRVTLGDFAQELLVQIFTFVDGKTLVNSCLLVCWSWKSAIDGSMELQLVIELWADGMVAGDLPGLTIAETLDALYERRRAWLSLNWSSRIEFAEILGLYSEYDLTGGVLGQLWNNSFTTSWFPSARNPTTRTLTGDIDVSGRAHRFVMDPSQDLVVFLCSVANNEVSVDCRSLSSLEPHPLAALPMVLTSDLIGAVDLAGDILSLCYGGRPILFNWREGAILAGIDADFPPVPPASFRLLSPRACILGYGGHGEPQYSLEIWAFEGNVLNHMATLLLPELVESHAQRYGPDMFTTHCAGFCAIPGAGKQFSKSNDERLFVVQFIYKRLVVHFRYLLQYLTNRDGPVVVPWDEWGPQHTRMWELFGSPGSRAMHGERLVYCSESDRAVRVLDFGMSALRRHFPGEAQPDAQCVTKLHTEPSIIADVRFAAGSVTTSLPYREVVRSPVDDEESFRAGIQYGALFIDDHHIVGVENIGVRQMVYTF